MEKKKMGRKRKSYTENFKRKIAIEAIREKKTVAEIAAENDIAPSMVSEWKQRLLNGGGQQGGEAAGIEAQGYHQGTGPPCRAVWQGDA